MIDLDLVFERSKLNSSFSIIQPGLQIAFDSTSMGLLKECPRKYYYSIICGWRSRAESVHLTFGLHYHKALEAYDHGKAKGMSHEDALDFAVHIALTITWDKERSRPWSAEGPASNVKNRYTLVRSIVWYLDQFADDPMETVILANGKPAVELSFRFETSYIATTGEPFMLCGHLDRLAKMDASYWILDRKTSKNALDERFMANFSPSNQMSQYSFAGKVVWNIPVQGVIIDGAQLLVSGTRFRRGFCSRDDDQLNEWYHDMGLYMSIAESYARQGYWPMNDKSCGNYGGCEFQGICARSPKVRNQWLRANYDQRLWDPLQIRGDI